MNRKILISFFLTIFFSDTFFAQKAKEKLTIDVLRYYQKDVEKKRAAIFLLDNMSIQKSINYKWVDAVGKEVYFNELDYLDLDKALDAFNVLKDSIKIHPKNYITYDTTVLTDSLLIHNIDLAFDAWKNNPWSQSYSFETFCEFILPYRSLVEPLEDWREEYRFLATKSIEQPLENKDPVVVATQVILGLKDYRFLSTRPDPIPVLSPRQLLFRRSGACLDLANLALLACRSIGLAATFDFTPHYGASSNRHYWNTIIDKNNKHIPFNGNAYGNNGGLPYAYDPLNKRLAKVFRKTFSIQKESLAFLVKENEIPDSFLKEQNILDVTEEYTRVDSIMYSFLNKTTKNIAYLNVFNTGKWKTVDWSKKRNNQSLFKNVGTNLVYLPSVYSNNDRMILEPYPILLRDKVQILKPNYQKTFDFNFNKENCTSSIYKDYNSLDIQDGETYRLLVWDHKWKKIDASIAKGKNILFKNVPENGLFFIVSKNSNGYERIFTINTVTKKITWY